MFEMYLKQKKSLAIIAKDEITRGTTLVLGKMPSTYTFNAGIRSNLKLRFKSSQARSVIVSANLHQPLALFEKQCYLLLLFIASSIINTTGLISRHLKM